MVEQISRGNRKLMIAEEMHLPAGVFYWCAIVTGRVCQNGCKNMHPKNDLTLRWHQNVCVTFPPSTARPGGRLLRLWTRSTIDVAHLHYFVSERRGSSTPNRRIVNIIFEKKKTFCRLGPWDYSPLCILIFAEVIFRVGYGVP